MYINLLKTKIVIFRNRGHVKAKEKWFVMVIKLMYVMNLCTLVYFFYYTGNFVNTQKMLSNQGRKAVFFIM